MATLKYPGLQKYDSEIKSFINNHYAPKMNFSATPVYQVTLAEATAASDSSPYTIQLTGAPAQIYVDIKSGTTAADKTLNLSFEDTDGNQSALFSSLASFTAGGVRHSFFSCYFDAGVMQICGGRTATGSSYRYYGEYSVIPLTQNEELTMGNGEVGNVGMYISDGTDLPAGTTITVYAAQGV